MPITFTDEQQQAYLKILNFIESDDNYFILAGYAGTGKTSIISQLANDCKIMITATTNKAVGVISSLVDDSIKCSTIHSLLCLKPERDNKLTAFGIPEFTSQIIVIDECSMIDSVLMDIIEQTVKTHDIKIIFCGDFTQLTPVGEDTSCVFYKDYPIVTLTTVMRQEVSPLQNLCNDLRDYVLTTKFKKNYFHNGCDIYKLPSKEFYSGFEASVLADTWKHNTSKYLAWNNKNVINVNKSLTKTKEGTPLIQVGDQLINNKYISKMKATTLKTDQLVYITGVKHDQVDNGLEGCYVQIDNCDFFCPYDCTQIQPLKKRLFNDKLLQEHYYVEENFIDLRSNYALTVHKAQGQTFEHVYVDWLNINKSKYLSEDLYRRMFYVAVSRASKAVYIHTG